jgi:long-chain acyl-CoA synthetase
VETVQEDIRETGPTVLFWGARNWESVNRLIQAKIADTTFLNRFLYASSLKIGYKIADAYSVGNRLPFIWKVLKWIVYWAVFKGLRDRVGLLRVSQTYTAGAPISPDVVRYFAAVGVPIKVGYGASEFPIISSHRDGDIKAGTSGPPLPEVEVKIAENGEILAKGEYKFSGYYKAPSSYEEKVKNGWLHTGDFGYLREDKHLVVMDRMQDLRRLRDGTQFSPQFIESRLRFSTYIKDVLIIGDVNRDYVGAIVNVDLDNAGRWAERRKIAYTTIANLSQHSELIDLIKIEIVKVNELLPKESRVRRFAILHKEFDPDEAELTRTRKVKRDFMEQRYLSIMEAMYSEKNIVDVESEVVYRDGRRGMQKTEIKITTVF